VNDKSNSINAPINSGKLSIMASTIEPRASTIPLIIVGRLSLILFTIEVIL
jgi:hypothetical protein